MSWKQPRRLTARARAYELLRGIGKLCIGHESDSDYDPRRLIDPLLRGPQQPR
ncbi:hypothetical protein [Streptomyces sp. NPDC102360]|uniref:hypothetical protein n=1 Tax=Streptomyces sp. NPDC102360 TaxID=3366160 RepID=UPI00381C41F7